MFKFSEVLAALSHALDMVEGQPEGHVVRSCYIGMTIGERIGLSEDLRSALFYALLLKDAGCSANSFRTAVLFDADDFGVKRSFKTVDWSRLPNAVLYAARSVSPQGSAWTKARQFFSISKAGPDVGRELIQIRCERGAEITRLMGFAEETAGAIRNLDEHWDGSGHPNGLKGDEIPLLARICGLAQTAEVFYSAYGPERAEKVVRARRKRWFDPDLVDVFLAEARVGRIWENLREDITGAISRMEPEDRSLLATPERLDLAAFAFAQIIDAKSPYTLQHSEGVANVAIAISAHMGFGPEELRNQKRAGLLHDIGKLGISNSILDKHSSLTDEEFAKIKTHPRLSHEILSRVPPFESIVERAANHHEKLDGSGYPRGLTGEDLDLPSRILTVADIYDALGQDRPYRRALPKERVMEIFDDESGTQLCPESVTALKELVSKCVI